MLYTASYFRYGKEISGGWKMMDEQTAELFSAMMGAAMLKARNIGKIKELEAAGKLTQDDINFINAFAIERAQEQFEEEYGYKPQIYVTEETFDNLSDVEPGYFKLVKS